MPSCVSLYGVRVSSSGLIYAVIVGAWAAYLVPMWLRRQDELNEARPTERFSTAIRLLSGRAGMERRYARELQERVGEGGPGTADPDVMVDSPSSIDVRSFAVSPACPEPPAVPKPAPRQERPAQPERPARRAQPTGAAAERARRMKALARRRRTTVLLFGAFTLGSVVAAVGGLAFLWAPAAPALLLSTYIVYLRAQERRRFAFTMDRRRAEQAAQRLRENRPLRQSATELETTSPTSATRSPNRYRQSPPRRRAAAPWSSRPITPSGSTSSANAAVSRATAGSRYPYRSRPMSLPRSLRARRAA